MNKNKLHLFDKKPTDLLFAFPDGVLDYSCSECNGLCCRGHTITENIMNKQSRLFQIYPALESAVIGINGTIVDLCSPSKCFFLDDNNLCRIEKTHGKEYKFSVCRIFPFNSFAKINNVILITPNYLCPLRLKLPAMPGEVAGTYQELRCDILNSGLLDNISTLSTFHATENPYEFLQREMNFCDLCNKRLGKYRFRETLDEITKDKNDLRIFLNRALGVLRIKDTTNIRDMDLIDNQLHTISPQLRLTMHRLSPEARIRALLLYEVILRRLSSLGKGSKSLKEAFRIFTALSPMLRLLARYSERVSVPLSYENSVSLPPKIKYGPLVQAAYAAVLYAKKGKTTMEVIENALEPEISPALRSAFLGEFARWLEGLQAKSESTKKL
jgi:hypothetical protein